jgi:hypothetical protein
MGQGHVHPRNASAMCHYFCGPTSVLGFLPALWYGFVSFGKRSFGVCDWFCLCPFYQPIFSWPRVPLSFYISSNLFSSRKTRFSSLLTEVAHNICTSLLVYITPGIPLDFLGTKASSNTECVLHTCLIHRQVSLHLFLYFIRHWKGFLFRRRFVISSNFVQHVTQHPIPHW